MRIGHYMVGLNISGGMASYIRRVSEGQRAAGHEVMLFEGNGEAAPGVHACATEVQLFEQAEKLGVEILHIHRALDHRPKTSVPIIRTMHGHWYYCPSGSRYLGRPGVPCERAYSLGGCLWGHVVDRCGTVRPAGLIESFRRTWNEWAAAQDGPVLAISEFVRSQMIRSGCDAGRVRTVYLPCPTTCESIVPAPDGVPIFLAMGRLVFEKGLHCTIEALARMREPATLEIAGHGPQLPRLQALARSEGVERRVRFLDWLGESEVNARMRAARAVLMPSLWHEPAGLIPLEAAAQGRAAVASRVGGIPEYAQRLGNVMLVEPNDPSALAQAMDQLAASPELAAQLGHAGWNSARGPASLQAHLAELDDAYEKAIQLAKALN